MKWWNRPAYEACGSVVMIIGDTSDADAWPARPDCWDGVVDMGVAAGELPLIPVPDVSGLGLRLVAGGSGDGPFGGWNGFSGGSDV